MIELDRREFISIAVGSGAAIAAASKPIAARGGRKMTICFSGGAIGISADQRECVELAAKYGFESVEAHTAFLAALSDDQLAALKSTMQSKGLVFGAAGLPVEFRKDDSAFAAGMKGLPNAAEGLRRAGVTRMATWVMPSHDTLTYTANFKQHAVRLREAALVLKDQGIRLGLEYVGPRTLLLGKRYPFQHTMAEQKDLISEIGTGNVGFVLDTFHWWTSGDTEADLLSLRNEDIVSVDMNDGTAGVPRDEQIDGKRQLPCKTGIIDAATFINALNKVGYDGPVRAEPFNREVNALGKDGASAATIEAMRRAFALIK